MLGHDLPYYSIDENDVVEPALAFVAGDWDPKWYKYGPLFSYILALIYICQQWILITFLGWSSDQFFYAVFFDSATFYYIARAFHLLVIAAIAIVSARFCWRYYNKQTAYVVLVFSIAPVIELITGFTVRIDTLQGLLALLCLYFAVSFKSGEKYYKSYVIAGVFSGLVLATKPLTGLLLLPAVFVAHLLTCAWRRPLDISQFSKTLFLDNKGIYIFVIIMVLVHSLVHPYSIINFSSFWQEQYQVIFSPSDQGGSMPGFNFSWLFGRWGFLLATLALLSPLLLIIQRDKVTSVLVAYIMTFVMVFMLFKTRIYWYNSIIPVLLIVMAKLFTTGLNVLVKTQGNNRAVKPEFALVLALLFVVSPITKAWLEVTSFLTKPRADQTAQEWVEANLPAGSPIFTVGWYASTLPRLRTMDARSHAQWAEYFMYRRNENQPWVNRYLLAYKQMSNSGQPKYNILNIRKHYRVDYHQQVTGKMPIDELFSRKLPAMAKKYNAKFIITASPTSYTGDWESGKDVELLIQFNKTRGYRGAEVKIFKLL